MKEHPEVRQRRPDYMERLEAGDSPRLGNHRISDGVNYKMRGDIDSALD